MGFWDAVASAGPYANNLHLAPNMLLDNHTNTPITQFLQARYSSWRPTNIVKALKKRDAVKLVQQIRYWNK